VLPGDRLRGLPRLFRPGQAEALGASLRAEGWDVSVYRVPAYSHAGLEQLAGGRPLLNTFVSGPKPNWRA
jgi:predicted aminopeptidase